MMMERTTEIQWAQAEGEPPVERIILTHTDDDGTAWILNWTGGMPPTYWRHEHGDPEAEPIQRGDIPAAVKSRLEMALEDCGRRLQMVPGVL